MNQVSEPARQTPVAAEVDVLTCGGGPTGLIAAIAAARNGADTLLVEQHGFLGGTATAGLVTDVQSFHAWDEQVIRGIPWEFMKRLAARGAATLPSAGMERLGGVSNVHFDAEEFKVLADEMVERAGARILFHTYCVGVVLDGDNLRGVIVENKSGRQALLARTVVDATGDADIAAFSGVPCRKGNGRDGAMQPVAMMFQLDGDRGDLPPEQFRALVAQAMDSGDLPPWAFLARAQSLSELEALMRRDEGVDATNAEALSGAEVRGRRYAFQFRDFVRKYLPGSAAARLVQTSSAIGIRETRHIEGEYVLTADDYRSGRHFPDGICHSFYFVGGLHNPGGPVERGYLPPGVVPQIPYRCLVPKRVDNLLVAGRSMSGTHEAARAYRVMASCMAMGQAAGTAAALCGTQSLRPRELDPLSLRKTLVAQGAYLSGTGCGQ